MHYESFVKAFKSFIKKLHIYLLLKEHVHFAYFQNVVE